MNGASEQTRERVLQAAQEVGYRPDSLAQRLRSSRTLQLGVLFDLHRPFEVELVDHMFPAVNERGYHLLLGATSRDRSQAEVADELLAFRCEGLIVVGPEVHRHHLAPLVEEIPVVEIGRRVTPGPVDVVRNDDALGARQAVDHLVGLGHRDVAFVDGGANPGAKDRRAGYRAAMRDHHLADRIRVVPGGYAEDEGARAARTLMAREPLPTAVMTSNDLSAIGLLDAVIRAGVNVPGDLSVVGYDDSRFARLPASTSPRAPGRPADRRARGPGRPRAPRGGAPGTHRHRHRAAPRDPRHDRRTRACLAAGLHSGA